MRKFLFCLLFLAILAACENAYAAGRLNFMLINLTGEDIVEARICPTSYPDKISKNLLNTPLDPDTRIYIGPNYYGDQRFWNIQLAWANGYEQTFRHNRLTRYNTYIAYNTPNGVKLKQTFVPAFARYNFSPDARRYSYGGPNMNVAVSTPEKVNVAQRSKRTAMADQGKAARTTRDLVFEDDDDGAPVVEGMPEADIDGDTIAMKTTVELTRGGKIATVTPTENFQSGDKVRLLFTSNRDGHIYWLARGTSGEYQVLFPTRKTGMDNSVKRNQKYTVPARGAWKFDENKGTETIVAVLSPTPLDNLDRAVRLASEGDKKGASDIIAKAVDRHEQKRTTRDLVFEEEDDGDVNKKSQKANGDEPFVAIYELVHS